MNIESLLTSMEDLSISSPKCINALQRAAEISPYVTSRTIGPDIEQTNYDIELDTSHDKDKENMDNSFQKQKRTPKTPTLTTHGEFRSVSPTSPLNVSSLQNLDLETLVISIRLREAESRRGQYLRKCALELQEKRTNVLTAKAEQKNLEISEAHNEWIAKKNKQEEVIIAQAQMLADKQLQEDQEFCDAQNMKVQRQLQGIAFHVIVRYQQRFREIFERVTKMIMSHEAKVEHNAKVKQLVQMFDQLITKIKGSTCTVQDLQVAEKLCKTLESLEEFIVDDYRHDEEEKTVKKQQEHEQQQQQQQKQEEDLKQQQQQQEQLAQQQKQQEQQKQNEQEAQQLEQQQQQEVDNVKQGQTSEVQQAANLTSESTPASTTGSSILQEACTDRFKFYTHITTLYHEKVERVKPLQADESYKKFRFACQKAVNIPVNAISSVNAQHLRDKFEKLYSLISGQMVKNADLQFSINDHPLGRDYCLLLMAKKFVNQGDTAVSSNPQAAFPIASIVVSLWKSVPEFGKIFLAYIFKESPFLVPYFIPQQSKQSLDDYYKVLGYRSTDNQLEPQEMYLKRQSGITRLYAAVMVTGSASQLNVAPHPYGIEHAWRWLSNFVMLEPLPDICATIIQEMLQTVGNELWSTYGKQFVKLLLYLQQQYFPKLSVVDAGGPKARLELLLNKYIKEGQISKPQGMLPPNFW